MSRITITVCDRCESQEDVEHYEVKVGTKRRSIDLCGEHRKPLEEVLSHAPRAAKKAAAKAATPRRKVSSLSEIEDLRK